MVAYFRRPTQTQCPPFLAQRSPAPSMLALLLSSDHNTVHSNGILPTREGTVQVHVSPETNSLLNAAAERSTRRGLSFVGVEHLFDALIESSILLPKAFREKHLTALQNVSRELTRDAWKEPLPIPAGEIFYTPRCANVLNEAAKLAERYRNSPPGAGDLLLALLVDAHAAPSRAMDYLQLPRGEIIADLRREMMPPGHAEKTKVAHRVTQAAEQTAASAAGSPSREGGANGLSDSPTIETMTRDLTQAAQDGVLGPAVGRDEEMFQILQILARKNKNNVMLVGEAGVGKTQIVEGLAVASVRGGMRGLVAGYRFLELNVGALMAGTQYRGAFEEKMLALLDRLKHAKDTVLFIDEAHLIMGAGATGGDSLDMANLLKPALARGEIRCIGATTLQEYRKFVEKDPAMERRFQMVRVEPLSPEATLSVLEKIRPSLERHHGVTITTKALDSAVTLTQRYMPNRHLPDKAIDVLDQACARHRLKAIAIQNKQRREGAQLPSDLVNNVTPHDIRKVISQLTAIPIEEMTANERLFLANLEDTIKRKIIGQDRAVAKTVAAVKKSRAGLADPHRPQAVLLFLGPSGVGKTQLAKTLADVLFGSPDHLVTFDMSEYTEEHSVSRLLGAPPGYVGSEEEGLLSAAVRNAPFSVLLFDEIEKAHRRVFDVLLPILDEGRLKDSRGREASFKNCIIIMTSNIGADQLHHGDTDDDLAGLMDELRRHFRPEFINRIDEVVPFYPLLFEDLRAILGHSLRRLKHQLKEKEIAIHVYQQAYEHLAEHGYSPEFGARELRRTVDRLVVSPISDMLLRGQFVPGDTIDVLMDKGELTFRKGHPSSIERTKT